MQELEDLFGLPYIDLDRRVRLTLGRNGVRHVVRNGNVDIVIHSPATFSSARLAPSMVMALIFSPYGTCQTKGNSL